MLPNFLSWIFNQNHFFSGWRPELQILTEEKKRRKLGPDIQVAVTAESTVLSEPGGEEASG